MAVVCPALDGSWIGFGAVLEGKVLESLPGSVDSQWEVVLKACLY